MRGGGGGGGGGGEGCKFSVSFCGNMATYPCRSLVKSVDTLRVELEKIKPSDFGKKTDEELGYANDELPISIT